MLKEFLHFKRDQKGFTMVELMVVIVIIGILSGIAIPIFATHIESAKIGRAVADLKSVKNLVELYKIENGEYPSPEKFKELLHDNGLTGWGSTMKDPWDRAYVYYVDGENLDKYVLWSGGPKEDENIQDDIVATQENQEPLKDKDKSIIDTNMEYSSSLGEPVIEGNEE